ncbi:periodic tryptophan protein 2 homolog [Fundulus heteroclitus]|uniref:periodic tryptophan protein 2 homolog n=1 Tax=Fundulus heteroclitus TaxID=8078 RepID=UPI00165BC53A|nr:periodic tryptophan protein 2 homolog [Fundulus heteroclitus]
MNYKLHLSSANVFFFSSLKLHVYAPCLFSSDDVAPVSVCFSSGLCVTYRPDGQELAVATLNGEICFWNPQTAAQTGSIAGRHDLEAGRKDTDKITAKQSAKGKSFTALCYSADRDSILAGGHSKFVCIYNVAEQMLTKKFEIFCNLSFDAMEVKASVRSSSAKPKAEPK